MITSASENFNVALSIESEGITALDQKDAFRDRVYSVSMHLQSSLHGGLVHVYTGKHLTYGQLQEVLAAVHLGRVERDISVPHLLLQMPKA